MANGFSYAKSVFIFLQTVVFSTCLHCRFVKSKYSAHEWANMGQGAPEVGPIPGAAERPTHIDYPLDALEYGMSQRCIGFEGGK